MYEQLIPIGDLPESGIHRFNRDDRDLIICVVDGQFFVLENRCSHQSEELHRGRLRNGCIYCPYHGACFDLATGAAQSAPATKPITVYPSRVRESILEAKF